MIPAPRIEFDMFAIPAKIPPPLDSQCGGSISSPSTSISFSRRSSPRKSRLCRRRPVWTSPSISGVSRSRSSISSESMSKWASRDEVLDARCLGG